MTNFELKYHPRKVNIVFNALSMKELHNLEIMILKYGLLEKVWDLNLDFTWTPSGVLIVQMNIVCNIKEQDNQDQLIQQNM